MTKKINKDPKPTARTVARRQELAGAVTTAATDKYYYIGLLVNERKLKVFADIRKAETVLAESGYDFVSAPFESIASAREELNRLVQGGERFEGWLVLRHERCYQIQCELLQPR